MILKINSTRGHTGSLLVDSIRTVSDDSVECIVSVKLTLRLILSGSVFTIRPCVVYSVFQMTASSALYP